jgi:hypothetical protein
MKLMMLTTRLLGDPSGDLGGCVGSEWGVVERWGDVVG